MVLDVEVGSVVISSGGLVVEVSLSQKGGYVLPDVIILSIACTFGTGFSHVDIKLALVDFVLGDIKNFFVLLLLLQLHFLSVEALVLVCSTIGVGERFLKLLILDNSGKSTLIVGNSNGAGSSATELGLVTLLVECLSRHFMFFLQRVMRRIELSSLGNLLL